MKSLLSTIFTLSVFGLMHSQTSFAGDNNESTTIDLACEVKCDSFVGRHKIFNGVFDEPMPITGRWDNNSFIVKKETYYFLKLICSTASKYVASKTFAHNLPENFFDFDKCATRPVALGFLNWNVYNVKAENDSNIVELDYLDLDFDDIEDTNDDL